ncbi:hypothetical protein NsoK4_04500 [Nitrosopumilus sp. K4]|uniref:hypothetical protein n=1 Tax=Nitrosopumilus sp. K4 TaxID=2795383 RepID=UPI001BA98B67|nr:hypothetical protein [Nitrosopumilus sp. K4]QUC65502.1 hypothetical protein NsoK4_04500 [Nitrosopumilus sp. K4]
MFTEKFQNKTICCSSCKKNVFFELIEDIECDMGHHDVIQCPNCQELFSIDKQCPAFQDMLYLVSCNATLFTESEKSEYSKNPHCF